MKNRFLFALICLSILIQAMIPVGFMPAHAGQSSYIEICSGLQVKQSSGEADFDHTAQEKPCPYFNIGSHTLPDSPINVLVDQHMIVSAPLFIKRSDQHRHDLSSHYTRGPPSYS